MSDEKDITEYEWFNSPSDSDTVWRYMDFSQYVSLLTSEDNELWFSRVDKFDDPYEGMPTEKQLTNGRGNDRRIMIERYKGNLEKVYANCWYNGEGQSDAMWKLYPNSDEGVAIKTTVGNLKSALQTNHDLFFANIEYIDWEDDSVPLQPLIAPSLHKRDAFKHEQEMRVVLRHETWEDLYGHPYGQSITPSGVPVQSDLNELIEEVYTGPKASDWFHETVERLTDDHVSKPVKSSNLYNLPDS